MAPPIDIRCIFKDIGCSNVYNKKILFKFCTFKHVISGQINTFYDSTFVTCIKLCEFDCVAFLFNMFKHYIFLNFRSR